MGALHAPSHAQIDRNTNGFSDVWESAYGSNLSPSHDLDGDGFTNREEADAGTNPHNATDFPRSGVFTMTASDMAMVHFPSIPGVRYQIEASTNLLDWAPYGSPIIGNGDTVTTPFALREAYRPGGVSGTVWTGLTGYGITLIKDYATNATAPTPALTDMFTSLEVPQTEPNEEQFGIFVRGWLIAPATGDFTFWLASDDSSELWLSTNENPQLKTLIASVSGWTGFREWSKYPTQQSAPIALTAGRNYYFEVYQRESYGGDHLSVAWTRPGAPPETREIIAAPYLTSASGSLYDLAQAGGSLSFRLNVGHVDSDLDGLFDFEERLLGLNPENATSTPRQPDEPEAFRILDSANAITIGATTPRAYEATSSPGQFTIYRAGGIGPINVPFTLSGSATPGVDFTQPIGNIIFAPGQRTATLDITPLSDSLTETAETVVVTLTAGTNYLLGVPASSIITIDDAPDILYVALLRSVDGVTAGGSGVGAVRRAGNALSSAVNLSFNGLSSDETAAEIYLSSNGLSGITVCSLPVDQVGLHPWTFAPTNGLTSAQIVEALDRGEGWMRIRTVAFPDGELTGLLLRSPGWQTMPAPVDPPPAPTAPATSGDAARFLTQATFGPTTNDMAAMTTNQFAAWIDHQLALPATRHLPYVQFRRAELMARDGNDGWQQPRQMAWWQHALTAPDQLRQRMAWALSQILVVSQFGALDGEHEGIALYYDILIDGAFGNYRDLLEQITLSPMMGTYLSMMRNQKPDPATGHEPDENYAREIMQLFSIGLTEMHNDGSYKLSEEGMPLPTYTQSDIVGLAHIFTGWSAHYDPTNPPSWSPGNVADANDWFYWGWDSMRPMSFYPDKHDTLDRTIVGGHTIPAGTNGIDRLDQALDVLFHHPNTGPFVARQLIQKFITSNPSPGYIHRVASVFNNNGFGVRGDLAATIKAVLLDYEARSPSALNSISFGKPIEPVMRLTRMLRAFLPAAPFAASGDHRLFMEFQWSMTEQVPQYASSVFNFFQPGYRQPGRIARSGLFSPEFQIYAETTALRQANLHYSFINWGIWTSEPLTTNQNVVLTLNLQPLVDVLQSPGLTPAQSQTALIDYLNTWFLFGRMSTNLRSDLESFFASLPGWYGYTDVDQRMRARIALYLVLNSPEFLVQR